MSVADHSRTKFLVGLPRMIHLRTRNPPLVARTLTSQGVVVGAYVVGHYPTKVPLLAYRKDEDRWAMPSVHGAAPSAMKFITEVSDALCLNPIRVDSIAYPHWIMQGSFGAVEFMVRYRDATSKVNSLSLRDLFLDDTLLPIGVTEERRRLINLIAQQLN